MKVPALILLLFVVICGCEDGPVKIIQVSGKVLNFGSDNPIQGAEVVLADHFITGGGFNDTSDGTRARVFTDAQGNFSLTIEDEETAYLTVWKDKCTFESTLTFSEGIHDNVMLKLKAEGSAEFVFKPKTETGEKHLLDIVIRGEDAAAIATKQFEGQGPFSWTYTGIGDTSVTLAISLDSNGKSQTQLAGPYYLRSFVNSSYTITY